MCTRPGSCQINASNPKFNQFQVNKGCLRGEEYFRTEMLLESRIYVTLFSLPMLFDLCNLVQSADTWNIILEPPTAERSVEFVPRAKIEIAN